MLFILLLIITQTVCIGKLRRKRVSFSHVEICNLATIETTRPISISFDGFTLKSVGKLSHFFCFSVKYFVSSSGMKIISGIKLE